jgi:hypothetical protein
MAARSMPLNHDDPAGELGPMDGAAGTTILVGHTASWGLLAVPKRLGRGRMCVLLVLFLLPFLESRLGGEAARFFLFCLQIPIDTQPAQPLGWAVVRVK